MAILRRAVWGLGAALAMACANSSGGGGGSGATGGQGNFGGFGNFGGVDGGGATGGFGNVGNTGGFGNTGNSGGVGNTGNTGGFGNTGNSGGVGNTGNTGGFGNTGNTGGVGGSTGANLGAACTSNANCGGGLICATASSGMLGGGGPAKGLCTADCTNDTSVCQNFGFNAVCLDYGGGASFCVESCAFGPSSLSAFNPNKCHGRQEVACTPLFSDTGVSCTSDTQCGGGICSGTCMDVIPGCLPSCNGDSDCGPGLYCDPATGLCGTSPKTGLPVGQTCTQPTGTGTDACRGTCTNIQGSSGPVTSICTEHCTLGAYPSCGWSGTGPANAACLFTNTAIKDPGYGDAGSCGQLCNCNTDCSDSNFVCLAWTGANASSIEAAYQKKGYCGAAGGSGLTTCN